MTRGDGGLTPSAAAVARPGGPRTYATARFRVLPTAGVAAGWHGHVMAMSEEGGASAVNRAREHAHVFMGMPPDRVGRKHFTSACK
jgi:hypothetical protein